MSTNSDFYSVRQIALDILVQNGMLSGDVKCKEIPHLEYPAYAVYLRAAGAKRGRHVFSIVYFLQKQTDAGAQS